MNVDTGVIVSIIALGLTIIVHLVATVWWASKMTANQATMATTIEKISLKLDDHSDVLYTKTQAHDDFITRDSQLAALWKRQDEMKEEIIMLRARTSLDNKH